MHTFAKNGCEGCSIKEILGTKIIECLEKKDCDWAMDFGNGRICLYRTNADAVQPDEKKQEGR